MRASREKAQESRERIVHAAARLLRERGFDGIGVADLMDAAGMTHGGFYRHFGSKDELIASACEKAFAQTRDDLRASLAAAPEDPFAAVVRRYVSAGHRDNPGTACALTTLAADAARRDSPELRAVFTRAVEAYLDGIATLVHTGSDDINRRLSIALLTEMVGAVVLSRVVSNKALADELVDVVADDITRRGDTSRFQGDDASIEPKDAATDSRSDERLT